MRLFQRLTLDKNQLVINSASVTARSLHDTIEDTDTTYNEIEKEFGSEVADGVLALSKNENLPSKAEKMIDSIERIKKQPKEIWMVKLSDRITNLQSHQNIGIKKKLRITEMSQF